MYMYFNYYCLMSIYRHQAREAEPKEYDINRAPERDLCKATYERIGNVTDGVSMMLCCYTTKPVMCVVVTIGFTVIFI